MQKEYFNRLGKITKNLCLEIEEKIQISINVSLKDAEGTKTNLSCNIHENGADIQTFSPEHFPDDSVFHELLHIKRILVEKIPKLVFSQLVDESDHKIETAFTKQDNAFEHLIIIPQEISTFPERLHYWEGIMEREWSDIHSKEKVDQNITQFILVQWVFLKQVLAESPCLELARSIINKHGLTNQSNEFFDGLIPLLGNKEKAMLFWFEKLGNPKKLAALKYFDVLTGNSHEVPLCQMQ
ncbi:hypothetical protein [Polynucleobacter rarus]|uniref:hypothetical protein n=1 Tax=Polynucleobacter rarus TaxID=556055 RepID=UPI000D3E38D7|nr:hypothetical protein [Polynucleobacter rarus]